MVIIDEKSMNYYNIDFFPYLFMNVSIGINICGYTLVDICRVGVYKKSEQIESCHDFASRRP